MKLSQAEKEEILLKTLKNSVSGLSPMDDPFNDRKLVNEQITAYCIAEWVVPRIDEKKRSRFRLVVETSLFGGNSKHLDILLWEKQKAKLNISR